MLSLGFVVLLEHALVVLLRNFFGDAFHAEDLDVKTSSVRERVVDGGESLLVDLAHMHAQAWKRGQHAAVGYAESTYLQRCLVVGRIVRT